MMQAAETTQSKRQLLNVTIYIFGEKKLRRLVLNNLHQKAKSKQVTFELLDSQFKINDQEITKSGYLTYDGVNYLVLLNNNIQMLNFISDVPFSIANNDAADIVTKNVSEIIFTNSGVNIQTNKQVIYVNEKLIEENTVINEFSENDQVLTKDYILVKTRNKFRLFFFKDVHLNNKSRLILQLDNDNSGDDFPNITRHPRLFLETPNEEFSVLMKKSNSSDKKNSLLKTILPPLGMFLISIVMAIFAGKNPLLSLGTGALSIITAGFTVSQYFSEKNEQKKQEEINNKSYQKYLNKLIQRIQSNFDEEKRILNYNQPTLKNIVEGMFNISSRIYERVNGHDDFLTIGLGLGELPSNLIVSNDAKDELDQSRSAVKAREISSYFSTQHDVPITVSLLDQTIGIVGDKTKAIDLLESIYAQISFFTSYHDLNILTISSKNEFNNFFEKFYLLNHFRFELFNSSGFIYDQQTLPILSAFVQEISNRKKIVEESRTKVVFKTHYVISIFDDDLIANHPIQEFLENDISDLGVTVVYYRQSQTLLPQTVSSVIHVGNGSSELVTDKNEVVERRFAPFELPKELSESLQALSQLNHVEITKSLIPENITILDQYFVNDVNDLEVAKRWEKAEPNKSIASVIGLKTEKEQVTWDLHERFDGPHALVGGTTGSGKSEFLTTYLLGLAINFSPSDIGILVIDWKGGGIANTLSDLPHFLGAITNLDGAGIQRALISIHAELTKRQELFAEFGVNNINGYQSLYKKRKEKKKGINYPKKPLPHLILVSDEFAELKANAPDFLDELTSVARIGRSLGVHLILATQKPSGVVNDQIQSNSRSSIALKMASIQDSRELLKSEDAAHIVNPGEGFLRVGENEVYEHFQSGYAGAEYDPQNTNQDKVDERTYFLDELGRQQLAYDPDENVEVNVSRDLPTQLNTIIEHIDNVQKKNKYQLPDKPWLDTLPDNLLMPSEFKSNKNSIPLGMLDVPQKQSQVVYQFDIQKNSHTAVYGSSGFGKSTLLQTIAIELSRQNNPNVFEVNLFDFGTNSLFSLRELPVVKDYVTLEETEKLNKYIRVIKKTIENRKRLLKKLEVTNFEQYNKKSENSLSLIVTILDGYDALSEDTILKDRVDSVLSQILRDGAGLGLYLVVTASRANSFKLSMSNQFATKIVLSMNNYDEMRSLLNQSAFPISAKPGRGLLLINDVATEIQFFLPITEGEPAKLLENLEKEIKIQTQNYKGMRLEKIPMVPNPFTLDAWNVLAKSKTQQHSKTTIALGLDRESSEVSTFELFKGNAMSVLPVDRRQSETIVPTLVEAILSLNLSDVTVIDANQNEGLFANKKVLYIGNETISSSKLDVKKAIVDWAKQKDLKKNSLLIIFGLQKLVENLALNNDELISLFNFDKSKQLIVFDYFSMIGAIFNMATKVIKENSFEILFNGNMNSQQLVDDLTADEKKQPILQDVLHSVQQDAHRDIVFPTRGDLNEK